MSQSGELGLNGKQSSDAVLELCVYGKLSNLQKVEGCPTAGTEKITCHFVLNLWRPWH